jgi:hypothetical protein
MSLKSDVENQKDKSKIQTFFGEIDKSILKYIAWGVLLTFVTFFCSVIMISITASRSLISDNNYYQTSRVYNGQLEQDAPTLNNVSYDLVEEKVSKNEISLSTTKDEAIKNYVQNAEIVSSNGDVLIKSEFVKKGLDYQPTFETNFQMDYVLKNKLDEKSLIAFEFPLPYDLDVSEMSDVILVVNGEEVENPKTKILSKDYLDRNYKTYPESAYIDGLKWEGELEPLGETNVTVKYTTKGLGQFVYTGFENTSGMQDFNLKLKIEGTRAYDVVSGLSTDKKEFSGDSVTLYWEKPNLFSSPNVNVLVADKLAPGDQVGRVYVIMTFIFITFFSLLVWFGYKFNKKPSIKDLLILTFLFLVYFPFLHYLTSFTVDPTMEVFAGFENVGYFSLSLYSAFGIALSIILGLMIYSQAIVHGLKYSLKTVLPTGLIMLGFFPMVITIPEYSILLSLVGLIILTFIFIQFRGKEK